MNRVHRRGYKVKSLIYAIFDQKLQCCSWDKREEEQENWLTYSLSPQASCWPRKPRTLGAKLSFKVLGTSSFAWTTAKKKSTGFCSKGSNQQKMKNQMRYIFPTSFQKRRVSKWGVVIQLQRPYRIPSFGEPVRAQITISCAGLEYWKNYN